MFFAEFFMMIGCCKSVRARELIEPVDALGRVDSAWSFVVSLDDLEIFIGRRNVSDRVTRLLINLPSWYAIKEYCYLFSVHGFHEEKERLRGRYNYIKRVAMGK